MQSSVLLMVSTIAAYLVVGLVSLAIGGRGTQTLPVWLAAGAVFGLLVVAQRRHWVAITIGGIGASAIWGAFAHGLSTGGALVFAVIEMGSVVVGTWFATQSTGNQDALKRLVFLIAGICITSSIGATFGAMLWRWLGTGMSYGQEWRTWACSTALGILLVSPVLSTLRDFRIRRSGGMTMARFVAGLAVFLIFMIAAVAIFKGDVRDRFGAVGTTLGYVPMPFLLIASMLWGPAGGALAMLVGALLVVGLTAAGGGPFVTSGMLPSEAVCGIQAYVAVWAILVLFVRAFAESRRLALLHATEWQLRYERVLSATGGVSVEFDARSGMALWGESARDLFGPEADSLAHVSDWLAHLDSGERDAAEKRWRAVVDGEQAAVDAFYTMRFGAKVTPVQVRLAGICGPDGTVERVAGLLRAVNSVSDPGMRGGGACLEQAYS